MGSPIRAAVDWPETCSDGHFVIGRKRIWRQNCKHGCAFCCWLSNRQQAVGWPHGGVRLRLEPPPLTTPQTNVMGTRISADSSRMKHPFSSVARCRSRRGRRQRGMASMAVNRPVSPGGSGYLGRLRKRRGVAVPATRRLHTAYDQRQIRSGGQEDRGKDNKNLMQHQKVEFSKVNNALLPPRRLLGSHQPLTLCLDDTAVCRCRLSNAVGRTTYPAKHGRPGTNGLALRNACCNMRHAGGTPDPNRSGCLIPESRPPLEGA